jgi:hypothetical protein
LRATKAACLQGKMNSLGDDWQVRNQQVAGSSPAGAVVADRAADIHRLAAAAIVLILKLAADALRQGMMAKVNRATRIMGLGFKPRAARSTTARVRLTLPSRAPMGWNPARPLQRTNRTPPAPSGTAIRFSLQTSGAACFLAEDRVRRGCRLH